MGTPFRTEDSITLRFGGGINTRMSIDDVDPSEATDGKNFEIDLGVFNLRPRKGFEKVLTAANTSEIRVKMSCL